MPKSTPISDFLSQELIEAVKENYEEKVRQLLDRDDVDVNVKDWRGHTPLHIACIESLPGCVKLLLARDDIDVNVQDRYGRTPLHIACGRNLPGCIELLFARDDINVNVQDEYGGTPLHYASLCGESKCITLLLTSSNIDVNITNTDGQTPLHFACSAKNFENADLLLQMPNIDISICDNESKTPLDALLDKYYEEKAMAYTEDRKTIEYEEKYIQLIKILRNYGLMPLQLSPENQEKLSNLSPNDIKMPENKAFLDECVREVGIPQLFVGLGHKQQSALLDVYASEIRANDRYINIIGQIVYATHKAEKEKKRQESASQIKDALCQNQRQ